MSLDARGRARSSRSSAPAVPARARCCAASRCWRSRTRARSSSAARPGDAAAPWSAACRPIPRQVNRIRRHARLRVSELQSVAAHDRAGELIEAPVHVQKPPARRMHCGGRGAAGEGRASPTSAMPVRPISPAASSSAPRSPGRWRCARGRCCSTSRPRRWTPTLGDPPGRRASESVRSGRSAPVNHRPRLRYGEAVRFPHRVAAPREIAGGIRGHLRLGVRSHIEERDLPQEQLDRRWRGGVDHAVGSGHGAVCGEGEVGGPPRAPPSGARSRRGVAERGVGRLVSSRPR